ncbi:MAG: Hsp20/alpha crystallin family protein [bacterium]
MALLKRREKDKYPVQDPRIVSIRDEMNRMFDDFYEEFGRSSWPVTRPATMRRFSPSTDVTETDSTVRVSVELPGMTEDDVTVEVEEDLLIISGEKKWLGEEVDEELHWTESAYGRFMRQIPLPAPIEVDDVSAGLENGRLEVVLPKSRTPANRRKIELRSE